MAALVVVATVIVACRGSGGSTDSRADDLERFCAEAPDPAAEVPASFVGSAEHTDALRDLSALAPAELVESFDVIVEHFDKAVDPSDPDSQLVQNFPEDVNAATARVSTFIEENCDS